MLHLLTPLFLPFACSWIADLQRSALERGLPLNEVERTDAIAIGVQFPDRVRLLRVDRIPLPDNPVVRKAGLATGLLSVQTAGLAAGYGILVHEHHWRERFLVVHELVHVMQCERAGGIRPFLRAYLRQCLQYGYVSAPLEMEAVDVTCRVMGD